MGSFQRADAGRTKNRILSPTSISTRTKRALLLSRKAKEKPNLFTKLRLLPPFKTTGVPSHRNLLLLFIHKAAVARRRQKIAAISNFWTGGTNRPGRRVNSGYLIFKLLWWCSSIYAGDRQGATVVFCSGKFFISQ